MDDGREDIAVANGHVVQHPINAPLRQTPLLLVNRRGAQFERAIFPSKTYFADGHVGRLNLTGTTCLVGLGGRAARLLSRAFPHSPSPA